MRETWYVLDDGEAVDPNLVAPDEDGVLRHADGRAVAVGPHGPMSRGVDLAAPVEEADRTTAKARGYKTREAKAR